MDPDAPTGRVSDVASVRPQAGDPDMPVPPGEPEEVLEPPVSALLCRLEELVALAAATDRRSAPAVREVIEGYFDAIVAHATVVRSAVGERPPASSAAAHLVRDHIGRLRDALAGGAGADLDDTVRAASALVAVESAVFELTELDPATVRRVVTEAAVAIVLSGPGLGTGP
jgi:hypothetical protein